MSIFNHSVAKKNKSLLQAHTTESNLSPLQLIYKTLDTAFQVQLVASRMIFKDKSRSRLCHIYFSQEYYKGQKQSIKRLVMAKMKISYEKEFPVVYIHYGSLRLHQHIQLLYLQVMYA